MCYISKCRPRILMSLTLKTQCLYFSHMAILDFLKLCNTYCINVLRNKRNRQVYLAIYHIKVVIMNLNLFLVIWLYTTFKSHHCHLSHTTSEKLLRKFRWPLFLHWLRNQIIQTLTSARKLTPTLLLSHHKSQ